MCAAGSAVNCNTTTFDSDLASQDVDTPLQTDETGCFGLADEPAPFTVNRPVLTSEFLCCNTEHPPKKKLKSNDDDLSCIKDDNTDYQGSVNTFASREHRESPSRTFSPFVPGTVDVSAHHTSAHSAVIAMMQLLEGSDVYHAAMPICTTNADQPLRGNVACELRYRSSRSDSVDDTVNHENVSAQLINAWIDEQIFQE